MRHIASPYAIVGSVAAIAGVVGTIALRIVDPVPLLSGTFGFSVATLGGLELLGVTFALVGALLVVRVPGNAVGWTFHPSRAGLWLRGASR